jgi:hypothetical protein
MSYEEVFNLCKVICDEAWDYKRTGAKVFSFQRAYGAGAAKISETTGIPYDEVLALIEAESKLFPEIDAYFEERTRQIEKSANKTDLQVEWLNKFKFSPINTLMSEIPKGVFTSGTFKDKAVNQSNNLKKILEVQAKYGVDIVTSGVYNAAGEVVHPVINIHSVFRVVDGLNKSVALTALPDYISYLDPANNPYTANGRSRILNSLFDPGTQKLRNEKTTFKLGISSGLQIVNEENPNDTNGINTTDLDGEAKFIQEFHSFLHSGVQELPRHASKSSSFYAKIKGGIQQILGMDKDPNLYFATSNFAKAGRFRTALEEISIPHLAAEFERIQKFKNNKTEMLNNKGFIVRFTEVYETQKELEIIRPNKINK